MNTIQRVRYEKSPLIEVIFQLRFPTILKISLNAPEEYQEEIRETYIYYEESIESAGILLVAPRLSRRT